MKKRKHHYVWRHYLKAWATGEQIWCCREGKRFQTNVENIAQSRDFYRIKEISDRDLVVVRRLIQAMPSDVLELANRWIELFRAPHLLAKAHKESGAVNAEADAALDVLINDMEENHHESIEASALQLLPELQKGTAVFLDNPQAYTDLCVFLTHQYLRTEVIKSNVAKALKGFPNFDIDATWGLLRTVFATSTSRSMVASRAKLRWTYLRAAGQGEFVASDQPLVNFGRGESLVFYYPLGPRLAALMDFDGESPSVEQLAISDDQVRHCNRRLLSFSKEQYYASSEQALLIATSA